VPPPLADDKGAQRELKNDVRSRVARLELPWNRYGIDPYGASREHLRWMLAFHGFFYRHYYSVKAFGMNNIPTRGRAMLVGNHSGGVAIDATMVIAACFLELEPPRLAQSMVEKFINKIPFASPLMAKTGQFTGLPEHAVRLLEDDRLILVFPEGARGTAKLFPERHSLVDFGTGFARLALKTKTPIIPFGFIGGGDAMPTVANAYTLGKLIGVPYVPITPYLLPIPLPASMQIRVGEPLRFEGDGNEDDEVILRYVDTVKERILGLIAEGLAPRPSLLNAGPPGGVGGGA
jgi:1-acyl-sn-glycerol-3-phosphate acyltransferase